jgi:Ca2+-binding RTX toxin-like protein
LNGNELDNRLIGDYANDTINGGDGDDFIGSLNGDDILNGGAGDDNIFGGYGADMINGGDGADTINYRDSYEGVNINLLSNIASGGTATGDIFSNIENVVGSDLEDVIIGDVNTNILNGEAGDDVLQTGGGTDIMSGGRGSDRFVIDVSPNTTTIIVDFDIDNNEKIDLSAFNLSEIVIIRSKNEDYDGKDYTTIILDNEQFVSLRNVGVNDLSQDNFIFKEGITPTIIRQIQGTNNSELLEGSKFDDEIVSFEGGDYILDGIGSDLLRGSYNFGDIFHIKKNANDVDTIQLFDSFSYDTTYHIFSSIFSNNNTVIAEQYEDSGVFENSTIKLSDFANIRNFDDLYFSVVDGNTHIDLGDDQTIILESFAKDTTESGYMGNGVIIGIVDGSYPVRRWIDKVYRLSEDNFDFYDGVLNGTIENDILDGGYGVDEINGNAGNDAINGKGDDDILSGGDGGDTFVISKNNNTTDTITDFQFWHPDEKINLTAFDDNFTNFTEFKQSLSQEGEDVHINLADGQKVVLQNTKIENISRENFLGNVSINSVPTANNNITIDDNVVTMDKDFIFTIPSNAFLDSDNDRLELSATLENGDPLPDWIVFDSNTNTITAKADGSYNGDISIKIIASDGSLVVSDSFALVIQGQPLYASNLDQVLSYTEDQSLKLEPIQITSISENDATVNIVLSDANAGTFNTTISTNGNITSSFENGIWGVSGDISEINQLLEDLEFTPSDNFNEDITLNISISDGVNPTINSSIEVTGISVNDAPITSINSAIVNEDNAIVIDVLSGAADEDGDTLTIDSVTNPTNGIVQIIDDKISYIPNANYNRSDSFNYTVIDGNGGEVTTTLNIDVTSVNDIPVATITSSTTSEDNAIIIDVLVGASDVDGDSLTIDSVTNPSNGTVNIVDGKITYTPNSNYNGSDSFDYTVIDGNGGSVTKTLDVSVDSVNDIPVTTINSATVDEDNSVVIDVLVGASDVENDALTIDSVTNGLNGVTQIIDGKITYTPNANYNGNDSFDYTVSDSNGGLVTKTLNVNIDSINDVPTATITSISTQEDNAIVIDVLAGANDIDDDDLSIDSIINPANGIVQIIDKKITYTPNQDYNGGDNFDYTISDGNGGYVTKTINLTVNSVNDAPEVKFNISDQQTKAGELFSFTVPSNTFADVDNANLIYSASLTNGDSLPGWLSFNSETLELIGTPSLSDSDILNIRIVASDGEVSIYDDLELNVVEDFQPVANQDIIQTQEDQSLTINIRDLLSNDSDQEGSVEFVSINNNPSNGTIVNNSDGTLTYNANENYNGADSFTYQIKDSKNQIVEGLVSVSISPVNDAPTASIISSTTSEDNTVIIDVLSGTNDIDGDILTIDSTTNGLNGITEIIDGKITYTPNNNYNGSDNFSYTIIDGNGGEVTKTLNIDITSVNDVPTATITSSEASEDNAIIIDVLAGANDVDRDDLTISSVTNAANGTTQIIDGKITYTPNSNYNGSDSFNYTIIDGNGAEVITTLNVNVTSVNDIPTATITSSTTAEDSAIIIDVLAGASDMDGDNILIDSIANPVNGTTQIINGKIVYTPNTNYNGNDSFNYSISDGNGGLITKTLTVEVIEVNDAPTTTITSITTSEDSGIEIDVLSGANDVDSDDLLIKSVTNGENGIAQIIDGKIVYTPNDNYNGTDSLSYVITDDKGDEVTTILNIVVEEVNDAPTVSVTSSIISEDGVAIIDVLAGSNDIDGDIVTIESVSSPSNGNAQIINGKITYTPNENYFGSDAFEYTVSDGNGGTATTILNVEINSVNDSPVTSISSSTTNEDNSITIDVLTGVRDVENDLVTLDSVTNGNNGDTQIVNGKITYTPNENYFGSDSFDYTVSDNNGGVVTTILNIDITSVNDAPVTRVTSSIINEDNVAIIDVLSGVSDVDGSNIAIESVTNANNGTSEIIDGKIHYTPNDNYYGTDSLEYVVIDNQGARVTTTLNVTINSVNDIPVTSIVLSTTNEDNVKIIDVLSGTNDADADSLVISSATNGQNGITRIINGKIIYTPNENYFGRDSFEYTVSDNQGGVVTTTLNVQVISVNDIPIINVSSSATTNEDHGIIIDILSYTNDADGDLLEISSVTNSNNGTTQAVDGKIHYTPNENYFGTDNFSYTVTDGNSGLVTKTINVEINSVNDVPVTTINSSTTNEDNSVIIDVISNSTDADQDNLTIDSVTNGNNGVVAIVDGKISYTPNANYNGSDSFSYTVIDGNGGEVTTTLNVDVTSVNDIPTATITSSIVDEDGTLTIDVLAGANDVESSVLTINSVSEANNGTTQIIDNKIIYTPNNNYNGSDGFDYVISDEDGGLVTKTLNVTIESINDAPVTKNDHVSLNEDGVATINALGNDFDAEDSSFEKQNISIITAASFGTVTLNEDLTFTYTPNKNENGQDSFTYQVKDSNGVVSNTSTVNININPINDLPFGKIGNQHIMVGEEFSVSLAELFSDIEGDALTFMANANNQTGLPDGILLNEETGEISGTINESGKTVIEVNVSDSNGGIYSTTFGVMVSPNLADKVVDIPEIKITNGSGNNDSLDATFNQQDLISAGAGDDEINYIQDNVWQDTSSENFFAWNTYSGDLVSVNGKQQSFDSFDGGVGNDTLSLTSGNDVLFLDDPVTSSLSNSARISGIEIINGGLGDDIIDLSSLNYDYGDVTLNGGSGDDVLWSNSGDDTLNGGIGNDNLQAGTGNDTLNGENGNDTLKGYDGDDILTGGAGADTLTGGFGFDSFNFTSLDESTINQSDLITDFTKGSDSINFSNFSFTAIVEGQGSGTTLGYTYDQGTDVTTIEDANSDFSVMLSGKIDLTNDDFNF